jgi:hypothetical protein
MGLFTERDEETPNQIILGKLNRIEAKLDAVIKAMHDYDGNDEYGESSFEAFMDIYKLDKDKDSNIQDERVVGDNGGEVVEKKRNNGRESGLKVMNEGQPKQKRYYKNNRSKRNENKK